MKVRYTKRCAGGCGLLLRHGSTASKVHRLTMCHGCARAHRATCDRCVAVVPVVLVQELERLF